VQWLLWLAAFGFLGALALVPVSYRITRAIGDALAGAVWFGLIALFWQRRPLRFALLGITLLVAAFLSLPARGTPQADRLRIDYIAGLQRYEGVTYFWGGEFFRFRSPRHP
jgi:hypothetical protein